MIQLRFVPISQWPGKRNLSPKSSPFRAGYLDTLNLLEEELNKLRAREIVLQAAISWDDIRNDGWPKSNARFLHAGVILTFEAKGGALSFPCDTYSNWQANLRAIALSLEALRSVNRYGVTKRDEQYQGWKALPPASDSADSPFTSKEKAAEFIAALALGQCSSGDLLAAIRNAIDFPDIRQNLYRRAAAETHPDRAGGSHDKFVRLQAALCMLEAK